MEPSGLKRTKVDMPFPRLCGFLAAAGLIATMIGCDSLVPKREDPLPPPPKVNLPETPPLQLPTVVDKLPTGEWTVAGLHGKRSTLDGQSVDVKAFVLDVYVCDPTLEVCRGSSHALLADSLERPKAQLVVVGQPVQIAELKPGAQTAVQGVLQQWSDDKSIVRSEGLLQLPPPPPPPEPEPPAEGDAPTDGKLPSEAAPTD